MYTYDFAYFGYPIDNYTRENISKEALAIIDEENTKKENVYEYSSWLETTYHGGSDNPPCWIGVIGEGLVDEADPHIHVRLSGYAASPNQDEKQSFVEVFEEIWAEVPQVLKDELIRIYGEPDFWVSEASS